MKSYWPELPVVEAKNTGKHAASPVLDINNVWEDIDDGAEDKIPFVLLQVPQLGGPLSFTPEALKVCGQAHVDNGEEHSVLHPTPRMEEYQTWIA